MALGDRVKQLIAEKLNVPEARITDDASFEGDLQLDSLDQVELAMALEDEFSLEIPDEDLSKMNTVGDVVAYLQAKGVSA